MPEKPEWPVGPIVQFSQLSADTECCRLSRRLTTYLRRHNMPEHCEVNSILKQIVKLDKQEFDL